MGVSACSLGAPQTGNLPIRIAPASSPGLVATSCHVNRSGTEVTGRGHFRRSLPSSSAVVGGTNAHRYLIVFSLSIHNPYIIQSDAASYTYFGADSAGKPWKVITHIPAGSEYDTCHVQLMGH